MLVLECLLGGLLALLGVRRRDVVVELVRVVKERLGWLG
jgi:hypothetical protein